MPTKCNKNEKKFANWHQRHIIIIWVLIFGVVWLMNRHFWLIIFGNFEFVYNFKGKLNNVNEEFFPSFCFVLKCTLHGWTNIAKMHDKLQWMRHTQHASKKNFVDFIYLFIHSFIALSQWLLLSTPRALIYFSLDSQANK